MAQDKKVVDCKWKKQNVDGSMSTWKARLIAKGIDYEKAFNHDTRMVTLRGIIAKATTKGWSLHRMDMKSAFLHGDL